MRVFNTNTFIADAAALLRPADRLVVVPGRKDGRRPPGDPVRAPGGRAHLACSRARFLRVPRPGARVAVPAGQELGRAGRPPRADRRPRSSRCWHRFATARDARRGGPSALASAVCTPCSTCWCRRAARSAARPAAAVRRAAWASCRCSAARSAPAAAAHGCARCRLPRAAAAGALGFERPPRRCCSPTATPAPASCTAFKDGGLRGLAEPAAALIAMVVRRPAVDVVTWVPADRWRRSPAATTRRSCWRRSWRGAGTCLRGRCCAHAPRAPAPARADARHRAAGERARGVPRARPVATAAWA